MDNPLLKKFNAKLDTALEAAKRQREEDDRRRLMSTIGQDLAVLLAPFLQQVAESTKINKETMGEMMHSLRAEVADRAMQGVDTTPLIAAIETAFGGVQVQPKIEVKIPDIVIPEIKMPEEMAIRGWVGLMANKAAVGYDNPLPVMLLDKKGNPVNIFEGMTQVISGGGGGKADFFTIKAFNQSAFAELMNADGRLRVSVETGGSGLTDAELRASAVPVSQVSGAGYSVNVTDAFGSTAVSGLFNADNRLRVSVETGGSGLTDAEIRATALPVSQVSGAVWSVIVNEIFGSIGASVINPDGRIKVELPSGSSGLTDTELRAASVPVAQASGANWSTEVTNQFATTSASTMVNPDNRLGVELPSYTQVVSSADIFATTAASNVVNPDNRVKVELPATTVLVSDITASVKAALVDSSGVQYSGSNPLPISGTVLVSDVTASIKSALVDSSGVQYSGSNPLPITVVSGALTSQVAVGSTVSDAVDDGSAPVKIGGIARTANPTAVAAGDTVSVTMDDLGRQLMRPVNVRDLILTARVAITNGTETTLLAAQAGFFTDLIYLMAANNSDAACSLDIRAVTGGNIMATLQLPANGTVGFSLPVPIPQDATGNNWTIDAPDETGRTITVTALFSKEV